MTHHMQNNALDQIGELLAEHGFDGMTQALTVLLNEVMKLERAQALGAGPYERSEGQAGPCQRLQAQDRPDPHGPRHPGRAPGPGHRLLPLGPGEGRPQRAGR